jgi:DNA-binding NtrC family response regulator
MRGNESSGLIPTQSCVLMQRLSWSQATRCSWGGTANPLSDMEPLEVSREMVSSNPRVPVIMTGRYWPLAMDEMAYVKVGVTSFVINPLDAPHLLEVIAQKLEPTSSDNEGRIAID